MDNPTARRLGAAALGVALVVASTGGPATAASGPHAFSCALAWQPDVPRATGRLDPAGVPTDLVVAGGSGATARLIYYLAGPMSRSAAAPVYRSTPLVYDATMTMGSTSHPAPYTSPVLLPAAFAMSAKAGTAATWKANLAVWPTPLPAAPNAVCRTTG